MSRQTKPPKMAAAVVAAKQAMEAKQHELVEARETVKRLEGEYSNAAAAMRNAQEEADATLPQCRIVRIHWRSGREEGGASVVILRRTPGGTLVVRHVGSVDGCEYKFKWLEHGGKYVQVERRTSYSSGSIELRDVPPEYLPAPA